MFRMPLERPRTEDLSALTADTTHGDSQLPLPVSVLAHRRRDERMISGSDCAPLHFDGI